MLFSTMRSHADYHTHPVLSVGPLLLQFSLSLLPSCLLSCLALCCQPGSTFHLLPLLLLLGQLQPGFLQLLGFLQSVLAKLRPRITLWAIKLASQCSDQYLVSFSMNFSMAVRSAQIYRHQTQVHSACVCRCSAENTPMSRLSDKARRQVYTLTPNTRLHMLTIWERNIRMLSRSNKHGKRLT